VCNGLSAPRNKVKRLRFALYVVFKMVDCVNIRFI
jgi:hypothetical protein